MNPNERLQELASVAKQLAAQAGQALQTGYHSPQAGLLGSYLATEVVPYGLKGLARSAGRAVARSSKANAKGQWIDTGRGLLTQAETLLREVSVNSPKLVPKGNSSRLLLKLNRVRRLTNPVSFFNTLAIVLEEISNYDLLWNRDIGSELARRTEQVSQERSARAALRASSPEVVRLSKTVDLYNRLQLADALREHPAVSTSVLGALDVLSRHGPDANRQAITSCRASIERLAIELGGVGDWKAALGKVVPSDTDRRAVIGSWNYLSGKGAHGGHEPTRDEAEFALRITISTLTYLSGPKQSPSSSPAL